MKIDLGGSGGGKQLENFKDKNHQVIRKGILHFSSDELKITQYHKH